MKKVIISLLASFTCALLLISCAKTTTTSPTAEVTTPTPSSTSESQKYGGTLRIIQDADMTNPGWPPDNGTMEDFYQQIPVFETLWRYDENTKIVPLLAQSWKEDINAKTITITLNQGINFQDGTPFDAAAAKWSLEMAEQGVRTGYDLINVSSIDVVDQYTLRVNFSNWDSIFLRNMCWDSWMMSPTAYQKNGKEWMKNNPVGTGPFKMTSFTRDVQKTYTKWDGYWQKGKPYLDKIVVDIIPNPMVQLAAFKNGDDDIAISLNPNDAYNLKGMPGVVLSQSKVLGDIHMLVPNSSDETSPFNKLQVRQACSYAIDTKTIADTVFKGFATVTNQYDMPGAWSYNPDIVGYPYDPGKAKDLLEEAGYPDGFDTILYYQNLQVTQDLYTAVAGYLNEVGIRAKLQPVDVSKFVDMLNNVGWYGLIGAYAPCEPELDFATSYLFTSSSPTGYSKAMLHPAELDENINTSSHADYATRQALYLQQQSIYIDKYCLFIPLVVWPPIAAKSTKVHDEYSCTVESNFPWTFADCWIEK